MQVGPQSSFGIQLIVINGCVAEAIMAGFIIPVVQDTQ